MASYCVAPGLGLFNGLFETKQFSIFFSRWLQTVAFSLLDEAKQTHSTKKFFIMR
jgi:hypothetical protein